MIMGKTRQILALFVATMLLITGMTGCGRIFKSADKGSPDGVWYEIFVRSYADSNGDGIGDFNGITAKLDYLNDGDPNTTDDLGVTGIWLMPINPSPSYHGYDVTDYYAVNPDYGTMADFDKLIKEAKKRGIEVIMDLVVNHTAYSHPWFESARQDENSAYRDYYKWATEADVGYDLKQSVWGHPVWNLSGDAYYYALFWDQMPDLNYENPAVREEVKKIARFWLDKGVDGFRMDAAMHIYGQGEMPETTDENAKNLEWWAEFDAACRKVNPNYYMVGEVWDKTEVRAGYSQSFGSTFDYDVSEEGVLKMVQIGADLGVKENGFIDKMTGVYSVLTAGDPAFVDAPFLTNHDQRRAMDYLGADNMASMKLAANIYLTLPGNPFIYYGEEIGMMGDKPDEKIREPFIWGKGDSMQTSWEPVTENAETVPASDQLADPDSLLNHYKALIHLRNDHEALRSGDFTGIQTGDMYVVAYRRSTEKETLYVVHNMKKDVLDYDLGKIADGAKNLVYSSNDFNYEGGDEVTLPAQTTLVFSLK